MDKLDPQLTAFLFRLVTIFIGIFGSVIVGVLAFFLKSLISEQKKADTDLRNSVNDVKIELEKVKIEVHHIGKDSDSMNENIEGLKEYVDRKLTGISWKKKKRAY